MRLYHQKIYFSVTFTTNSELTLGNTNKKANSPPFLFNQSEFGKFVLKCQIESKPYVNIGTTSTNT
jgi:hypothetical protein